jgi:pRiA4b ORF-3-like protein
MPRKVRPAFTSPMGSILQVKMRLVGISPMIWRRVLVPVAWTLEELHGVIQAAMGWEGLHLYEFRVRSARYGSPDLCGGAASVTLESLRFRRNAKLIYVYDMGDWWAHEVRIEDRLGAEEGVLSGLAPARIACAGLKPVCGQAASKKRSTVTVFRRRSSLRRSAGTWW